MADRVEIFQVTVTAGTAVSAAVETDTSFDDGLVVGIELVIPDGHVGLTGIQINQAHQQRFPSTNGTFISGNAEKIIWSVSNVINNGAWSVTAYNTDVYDHTFHVRYLVNELSGGAIGNVPSITQNVVAGAAYPVSNGVAAAQSAWVIG